MNIKNKVRSSYPSNAQGINHTIAENIIETWNKYMHKDQFLQPDATTPDNQKITLKTDAEGNLQGKNTHNTQMLAERILQDYAVTCLPSAPKFLVDDSSKYQESDAKKDLEYLNLKLDAVRKTITSGDVYNIKGVAESEEEVDQMISIATPNTAFISNVHVDKQRIAPGDIIFTDLNNVVHIIQHAAAGYFYPIKGEQQTNKDTKKKINTYKLTYSGSTSDPKDGSNNITAISSDFKEAEASKTIVADVNVGTEIGFAKRYTLNNNASVLLENYPQNHTPLVTIFTIGGEKIGIDNVLEYIDKTDTTHLTVGGYITNSTFMTVYAEVR